MAYYDITAFAGTTITGENVKQVSMSDTKAAISRIQLLENGAKFDADSTADADLVLGQVAARYQIVPPGNGMILLDGYVASLAGLLGKRGTLTGKQYGPSSTVTRTCTARCMSAVSEEVTVDDAPMSGTRRQRVMFTLEWEKLTEWA
jgi:hypothetical protein